MKIRSWVTLALLGGVGAVLAVVIASGDAHSSGHELEPVDALTFDMIDAPIGRSIAPVPVAPAVSTHGSTIASWGDGVVAIDGDSGELVRLDADGAVTARLAIGPGAPQLAVDRTRDRVYVADRRGDRICVIAAAEDEPTQLESVADIETDAEPFGLALTPDGATLLVTTVADRTLTAFATDDGTERWSIEVGPEPRGVAVSYDGARALVTYLNTGAVARVTLDAERPRLAFAPIPAGGGSQGGFGGARYGGFGASVDVGPAPTHFARGAFAVTYIGHDLAVVPHHSAAPGEGDNMFEDPGTYGGGSGPPIAFRVAFVGEGKGVAGTTRVAVGELGAHQPRAVAYDGARDILYVAGYGSDTVSAIRRASQSAVGGSWSLDVGAGCGPNGLDVTADGDVVVYCALTRQVARIAAPAGGSPRIAALSKSVADSKLSEPARRGRELFRRGNSAALSFAGTLACAGCHPEGRADGLSWRIEGKSLQTPLLAGRLVGTHPFKWDGQDPTLDHSLKHTVKRLGGTGITDEEATDLAAFLESLPAPRAPSVADRRAVKRGKELFHDEQVGCTSCHKGERLSDGRLWDLADDLDKVDTPSLIGLAHSAPYYHDGSAPTLEALLLENGSIHGMGDTSDLNQEQVADLAAYLRTL